MPKIESYIGGKRQARNLSEPMSRPHASADAFGAGQYRDLQAFGQSVGRLGDATHHLANVKQDRIDRTESRDMTRQLQDEYREWEKEQLRTRKGMDAKNLEKEAAQWYDERKEQLMEGLSTERAKRMFEPQFMSARDSSVEALSRYSFDQVRIGEHNSRLAQNETFMRDAETRGLLNDTLASQARQLRHANIRANLLGQSDEVVMLALQDSDREFYTRMAAAHASRSLQNAVEYLGKPDVVQTLGHDLAQSLKNGYQEKLIQQNSDRLDADAELYAIDRLESGDTLLQLQPELIEKFGHDRGKLAYQAAVTRQKLKEDATAKEAKQQSENRWNSFYEQGTIPEGVTRQERDAMLKEQERRAKGETSADPWAFGHYLIDNFSPDQLKQMQRDGRWGEIYPKLLRDGKESSMVKEVNEYMGGVKGTMTPERNARMQFIAVTGKRPTSTKDAESFNSFMDFFLNEAEMKAAELKLNDVRKLPREEQDKIIGKLLTRGDYGYRFWSDKKWQFEVMDDPDYNSSFRPWEEADQPFSRRRQRPTVEQDSIEPYLGAGLRDTVDTSAAGADITTASGVRQQVRGNTIDVYHPREQEKTSLISVPADSPEPENRPEILDQYRQTPDADIVWNGQGWLVTIPNVRSFMILPDGSTETL